MFYRTLTVCLLLSMSLTMHGMDRTDKKNEPKSPVSAVGQESSPSISEEAETTRQEIEEYNKAFDARFNSPEERAARRNCLWWD